MASAEKEDITLVIPCYNEQGSIPASMPVILDYASQIGWKVIVTDDGSTDSSFDMLTELQSRYSNLSIVRHSTNRGYGAALKSGIQKSGTALTATLDADGQHSPESITRLLEEMKKTGADMIIGSRRNSGSGTAYRNSGKFLIRKLARFLTGTEIHDINSGMKLFRTEDARRLLNLCPDTMAFSDILTLSFVSQKFKVAEAPIEVKERTAGKSTVGIGTAFDTVYEILNMVMLFNPIKIFLPIALILFLLGLAWGIPIMLAGRGVSVGAALLMLTGVMVFLLGLIAEQLSQLRRQRIER